MVAFLDHAISKDGIFLNPYKIEVVLNRERPKNFRKVWNFLGLAGYYR